MSQDNPHVERRRSPRREFNARGTAYVLCNSQITPIEVQTRNISTTGVLLVSKEDLHGDRMMLKLNVPEFADSLIECDVAHRSQFDRISITENEDSHFAYGLSFRRVIPEDNLHETLRTAFRRAEAEPDYDDDQFESADEVAEESLVPLLSAVGLAVVYASQYAIC